VTTRQQVQLRHLTIAHVPVVFAKLEELAGRMDEQRRAAEQIADYRTPSDRGLIGWATATPVSDGRSIWAVFGHGVVTRFDLSGERRWAVWLGAVHHEMRGYDKGQTASPALVGDTLIVPYNGLRGLDAATGAERWSVGQWRDYGSPAVGRVGDLGVVVTPDGRVLGAADGRELARGLGDVWYTSPILDGDVAYWVGGTDDAHTASLGGVTATAVRLSQAGSGVRATPLWSVRLPVKERVYSTPVVYDGVLYAVTREGTILALRVADGSTVYAFSLADQLDGETWQNLVVAGGVLYVGTDLGEVVAVRAGATYTPLGISRIGPLLGSPAFGLGRVYFRTYKALVAYGG
ncbi:MAG TPA: PQQ-binding-like beta-propeller repeat protein, partial [Myxococcota bacterium]|nr:PQQ-binding-like beta-propeller repeat protein [Myxococcota bacterium]